MAKLKKKNYESFLVVVVYAPAVRGPAAGRTVGLRVTTVNGVARVSGRTRARGHPIASRTLGVHAALAVAHIGALVVHARLVVPAFEIGRTLAASAPQQRVAHVTGQACAHRPLLARVIVAGLTPGVLAARVRVAQVGRFERPTPDERVPGHCPRTAANWRRASRLAVCVHTAHGTARARIHALFSRARRPVRRTVAMRLALGSARYVRISKIALQHAANDDNVK